MNDIKHYAGPLLELTDYLEGERQKYYAKLAMERDPIVAAEYRGCILALTRLLSVSDEQQKAIARDIEAKKQEAAGTQKGEVKTNARRPNNGYRSYNKRPASAG